MVLASFTDLTALDGHRDVLTYPYPHASCQETDLFNKEKKSYTFLGEDIDIPGVSKKFLPSLKQSTSLRQYKGLEAALTQNEIGWVGVV